MTNLTKSQEVAADVVALLRARNPLIWITTREEARIEGFIFEAAAAAGYEVRTWDVAQGARSIAGKPVGIGSRDAGDMLSAIGDQIDPNTTPRAARTVWVMRDLPVWLAGPMGAAPLRQLRNLARNLPGAPRDRAQAVVVLSPSGDVPPELSAHATVIDWPLPDRAEIGALLDATVATLPEEMQATAVNGARDAAIDAAIGLSGEEAQATFAKSLVQLRKIDAAAIGKEKKRVIEREKVLEWFDPLPGGLDAVGGLDVLKDWLVKRKLAYSPAARAYGLPSPKGCILVGVPGCGKSLTAKAVSTAWMCPLLKLDLGAIKSKYVGESESNLRRVFATIKAVGKCVVWIDEVEKALAGATQGAADGGVSSDALGALLGWMQDREGECFVIATANDAEQLPPELLRKGRFDEVFAIDLPTRVERLQILAAAMKTHGRDAFKSLEAERLTTIVTATEGFTGSEIAALIPDAMFAAFADGAREITVDDLLAAAGTVVPLIKTAPEKIARLRAWAKTRARAATTPETDETTAKAGRVLDL